MKTARDQDLPPEFVLPFSFQGDPVMVGEINGVDCSRIVLDTGAPSTVIRAPNQEALSNLKLVPGEEVILNSLRINSIEFGPVKVKVKLAVGIEQVEVYLGTRELLDYRITLDYESCMAHFVADNVQSNLGNQISFSKGRPTIKVNIAGKDMVFVLDTGSNANWIFFNSQTEKLLDSGLLKGCSLEAQCGLGNVNISESITFHDLNVGSRSFKDFSFYLAHEESFGGPSMTIEDGIIGTGMIASIFDGKQVVDFLSKRYYML